MRVLENADLSAAAESSRGDFEQAEAAYTTTVTSSLPQQIQKAQLDAESAKSAFDAAEKVYNSRKDLFQQGALPRRELDAAEVALVAARSQNEQAQKQLADLQRVGKEQALKSAQGQTTSRRKVSTAQRRRSSAIRRLRAPSTEWSRTGHLTWGIWRWLISRF